MMTVMAIGSLLSISRLARWDLTGAFESERLRNCYLIERGTTTVGCTNCGARYETPVEAWVVDAVKRCAKCGRRALVVVPPDVEEAGRRRHGSVESEAKQD